MPVQEGKAGASQVGATQAQVQEIQQDRAELEERARMVRCVTGNDKLLRGSSRFALLHAEAPTA